MLAQCASWEIFMKSNLTSKRMLILTSMYQAILTAMVAISPISLQRVLITSFHVKRIDQ